ncbi:MAG: hypothetical protein LBB81_05245 [Treponema sp.]|jgi:hypothetical protein|nr:hypothetical protein [Treponema sp.]
MKISRLLKPILFTGECIRVSALTTVYAVLQPAGSAAFPWIVFTASGALYPLITLFFWLDSGRYKSYIMLYFAGKCVNITSLLGWFIIIMRGTMNLLARGAGFLTGIILLISDILSILIIFLMRNDWLIKLDNHVPDAGDLSP